MPQIIIETEITKEEAQDLIVKKFNLTNPPDLCYTSFIHSYPDTAGPLGGIGGQMFTNFILEAWYARNGDGYAVIYYGKKILQIMDFMEFDMHTTYERYKRGR